MAIPGIDVTERPWAGSADARAFARDPGPGNPNVGRETLRAPAATPTASAVPTAPTAPAVAGKSSLRTRALASGGTALGKATKVLGPAVAGTAALSHLGDYRIDDPEVDSSAMGTLRAAGQGDLGGAWRSLSKGALEAGMDLGSMAANAADLVVPGQNTVSSAYDRALRGAFGDQLVGGQRPASSITPSAQAAEPGPVGVPTATAVPGAGRGFVNPPNVVPAPENQVAPGIYQHGRGQYSDNPNGMGMPADFTGQPNAQNMAAADNLAARESLRGAAGASSPGRPNLAAPGHSGNSWQARNDLRNLRVGASSITNDRRWGGEGGKSPDVQAYLAAQNADTALRGGMDPGSVARTNATASMYGDETRADATRYASDNSLRGTLASAGASRASAEARLRYDANKDSRDFKLRSDELGLTRDANRLKQREASEKNMVDRIAASIPPGPDGKPNMAAAAEQVRAMTARMAERQAQLEAELAKNPNNAQAHSELANIQRNGVGAVGMRGMDNFQTGMEAKSLRKGAAGWTPWSGKDVESNKPITSLKREEGLIWDDYVDDQGGRIPAREIDKRREQYKHLIQGN